MIGVVPGGGTRINAALERVADAFEGKMRAHWKHGKDVDCVLVTDGEDGDDFAAMGARFRARGASLFTIAIETRLSDDGVKSISIGVVHISGRDMGGPKERLDPIFSI